MDLMVCGDLAVLQAPMCDGDTLDVGALGEVAKMAVAHMIENKVAQTYWRGDLFEKRRRLMDDWAEGGGWTGRPPCLDVLAPAT